MTPSNLTPSSLPVEQAHDLAVRVLAGAGVPPEAAGLQADLLIDGELKGHPSHGLLRLPRLIHRIRGGVINPVSEGRSSWRGESFLVVDGQQGLGPVVARRALEHVGQRARERGVALAAISANNHLGMLGWYAEHIAARGLIVIGFTTSEALVHPYGGRRALIGTNPIAIGVPAEPDPFVLDMATSLTSMGKIHAHALRDEPLEPGWALDATGTPTTDAEAAKDGAIAPFGGAKGYGLGLAIELLVAALTGCALGTEVRGTLDATNPSTKGDVFIVIDPGRAPAHLTSYLDEIRASGDDGAVLIPGDRARDRRARARTVGVELPPTLLAELHALDPHSETRTHP